MKHLNVDLYPSRTYGCDVALVTIKFVHDESTMQVMFIREIPMLLEDWRRTPEAQRVPLRLRHLSPMQVLGKTNPATNRRAFTVANIPLAPVAASLPQADADAPANAAA